MDVLVKLHSISLLFRNVYWNREDSLSCRVILDNQDHQGLKERQDLKVLRDPEDFPDLKDLQGPMERMEYRGLQEKEDPR
jgi:hypothetical protein